jgi:hypothetical protein
MSRGLAMVGSWVRGLTKRLQPTGLVRAKAPRSAPEVRPAAEAHVVMQVRP